jgi:hypothetical protein
MIGVANDVILVKVSERHFQHTDARAAREQTVFGAAEYAHFLSRARMQHPIVEMDLGAVVDDDP